ncbi:hypothetical protein AMS68_002302 [Peltaster fructicola]|uniref:Dicer-like protein 2 n=1 Tax=Peltaster fructicola TaxID=286661 RepID=A0A6H0XQ74_9PEZI|nr:hypothetical protein AMS68_002302 [Peltaster fructicola]
MTVDLFAHRSRPYQLEMFERSLEGNRIIVMDTGSGKTQVLVQLQSHHCIKKHPANVIMRDFYHPSKATGRSVPHILGLSASLIMSSKLKSLSTIEQNLDSLSVTPRLQRQDLLQHVHRPDCRILHYEAHDEERSPNSPGIAALNRLIKQFESQCVARGIDLEAESPRNVHASDAKIVHKTLQAFRRKALHLQQELGLWAADYFVLETIQALRVKVKSMPDIEMDIKESIQLTLLSVFGSTDVERACGSTYVGSSDHISVKVKCLIAYILESDEDEVCGIVFVTQRVVASVLSVLLGMHPDTRSRLTCRPFVGTSNASSRKFSITDLVDLKLQKDAWRLPDREVNLVIATSVLEEGIDVQACNVVACFDPPTNLKSFIQRRGRARHQRSRLGVLVPIEDDRNDIARFRAMEDELTRICQSEREQETHEHQEPDDEDMSYVLAVESTGARLDADSTVSHLYHFCSQLSRRAFVDHRPEITYETIERGLIRAVITLPDTVPARVRQAKSKTAWKTEKAAMKDAAFHAYAALYTAGLLNDNLLPLSHEWHLQEGLASQTTSTGQISVGSQLNLWSSPVDREEYSVLQCRVTAPPSLLDSISSPTTCLLITHSAILTPPDIPLFWDNSNKFRLEFNTVHTQATSLNRAELDLLHAVTMSIFRAPRSSKPCSIEGNLSVYLIPDMSMHDLEEWHAATSGTRAGDQLFGHAGRHLVRVPLPNSPPYLCKSWIENDEGKGVVCEPLPRRRNFLMPTIISPDSGEASKTLSKRQHQVFPLNDSTFSSMPVAWARIGLFMPAIFQHIQDHAAVNAVMSELLRSISLVSYEHVSAALCAPSACRPVNYQRHEFIGDSILKFVTSCHLFNTNPDWPEGFLSQRRGILVCNATLASAALGKGLDKYIITEPIDYRNWTLPLVVGETHQTVQRQVSSKVLADVVEALIGAAWLDCGLPAAVKCIHFFVPSVPPSSDHVAKALSSTQRSLGRCQKVESLIGYTFQDSQLLAEALTHPTCGRYLKGNSYERLEFLGDAVLDMIVTKELASRIHRLSQGQMTQIKAALVNARLLGLFCLNLRHNEHYRTVMSTASGKAVEVPQARETSLASYLFFHSESLASIYQECEARYREGRDIVTHILLHDMHYPWVELSCLGLDKVYSDLVESILGAIFLDADQNLDACSTFIERLGLQNYMSRLMDELIDVSHPRATLQRRLQGKQLGMKTSKDPISRKYKCSVVVDETVLLEVEDCFDEEGAIVIASSKANQLLAAGEN